MTWQSLMTPRKAGAAARRKDGDGAKLEHQVTQNPYQSREDRREWYVGYSLEDDRRSNA